MFNISTEFVGLFDMLSFLQNLMVRLASVRVYSMSFLAVGRVVFEVAPDYCERYDCSGGDGL
jgi:hypothetical protein